MAMNMNGIMLHGRPMRVGRPSGFVRHESAHDALCCSHGLLRCNMLCCVATCGTLSRCAPAAPPRAHPSCSPRLASPRLASPSRAAYRCICPRMAAQRSVLTRRSQLETRCSASQHVALQCCTWRRSTTRCNVVPCAVTWRRSTLRAPWLSERGPTSAARPDGTRRFGRV